MTICVFTSPCAGADVGFILAYFYVVDHKVKISEACVKASNRKNPFKTFNDIETRKPEVQKC